MTKLFVQYNERCICSHRASGRYGDWSEEYDFDVKSVSATSRNNFYAEETINVGIDVAAGDVVFVLYMTYSTGDSFGRATGKGEVLWAFKDAAIAMKAKAAWEQKGKDYSIEFEVDGGNTITLSNPASGYFENLGAVDIATFLVNP